MAFKLRSNNTGSIPLHKSGGGSFKKNPFSSIKTPLFAIDPVIDPTKKEKEKEKPNTRTETTTTSDWRNTGEPVVAIRPGEQDGVSGTFIDTTTNRERDINQEVAGEGGGSATFNAAFAKARNQGLPSFTFGGKEYTTDLAEDKTRLETDSSLSTEFIPDPEVPLENPYSSYDTGYAYNADFGGGGRLGYVGRTDDPTEALRIVERGENVSAGTDATVKGLGTSQQHGGTSGMVDADRNNFQSEQGFVVGIRNEGDYDAYDNFGLGRLRGVTPYGHREGTSMLQSGAIAQEYQNAKTAILEKYRGVKDRTGLKQELQKLKDLRTAQIAAAQSGKFYSPEMKQRFEDSHDTIYERAQPTGLFTEPGGGGRSGQIATPSETTIDTGFLEQFLTEQQAERGEEIRSRRR